MKRLAALILLLIIGKAQAGGVYTNTGAGGVPVDGTVTPAKMSDYYTTRTPRTPTSGRVLVDFSEAMTQTVTVDAATQFYFTPPTTTNQTVVLELTNSGASAGYTFLPSPEVSTITTIADVSGSLDGKAFLLRETGNALACIWIDVDDGGGSAPAACAGADRNLELTGIVTNDSANAVASDIASELTADGSWTATADTNTVTIVDAATGTRTDLTAGTSGFTVAVTYQGDSTTMIWVGGSEPTWDTSDGILNLVRCVWDGGDFTACENTVGGGGATFSGVSIVPQITVDVQTNTTRIIPLQGTEDWDTDSYHSGTDAFITIPTTGKYEVNALFNTQAPTGGTAPILAELWIVKNDSAHDCAGGGVQISTKIQVRHPITDTSYYEVVSAYLGIFSLAAGDTLQLCSSHGGAGTLVHGVSLFQVTRR